MAEEVTERSGIALEFFAAVVYTELAGRNPTCVAAVLFSGYEVSPQTTTSRTSICLDELTLA